MNKEKRSRRAKEKAKFNRVRRTEKAKEGPTPEYKWDGESWIKLIPYWVKGVGQAYKIEVMPQGFEP